MKRIAALSLPIFWSILICFASLHLMGASSAPKQLSSAKLRIYKKGYTNSRFGIKINDQLVVKSMKNRTWFEVEVPAGKLTIETVLEMRYPSVQGKTFSLEVEAGKIYYLEAIIDYEFWVSTIYLVLREKERAEEEIKRFKKRDYELNRVK